MDVGVVTRRRTAPLNTPTRLQLDAVVWFLFETGRRGDTPL